MDQLVPFEDDGGCGTVLSYDETLAFQAILRTSDDLFRMAVTVAIQRGL